MIGEIVEGYGAAARRLETRRPRRRRDRRQPRLSAGAVRQSARQPARGRYGGSLENRLRFLREALAAIRAATGPGFIVGLRISSEDSDLAGLTAEEVREALVALDGGFDYYNLTVGSSASFGGAVHIAPSMAFDQRLWGEVGRRVKRVVTTPVFFTGRINQPQDAERLIACGEADMVGMTRALICDPEMPAKAAEGRLDDIRACIACNQACIGHFQLGVPISCIQHPETGRELAYGRRGRAPKRAASSSPAAGRPA